MCTCISAVFEFLSLPYWLPLRLYVTFSYNAKEKRMEEKAESFSLMTSVKDVDLTVNLLFFMTRKGKFIR